MKTKIFLIVSVLLSITGCKKDDENIIAPGSEEKWNHFEINIGDYSEENYFVSELYTRTTDDYNTFNLFHASPQPVIVTKLYIKDVEVFITAGLSDSNYTLINGIAYLDLPARDSDSLYPDTYRDRVDQELGLIVPGKFKRLSEGIDYVINRYTGCITFLVEVSTNKAIAVAYVAENNSHLPADDLYYGEFLEELINSSKTKAVLKLVKPVNVHPIMHGAWKLKLKNTYKIESSIGKIKELEVDIFLKTPDGKEVNSIDGKPLLQLFGLDLSDKSGGNLPDGVFDFLPGITFNTYSSEIIFPVLEPFGKNLPVELNDSLKHPHIYSSIKGSVLNPDNKFIIRGRFTVE